MVFTRAAAGESSAGPTYDLVPPPTAPLSTTLSTTVATTVPTSLPNAQIKLDNIKPLRGQENWSTPVSFILYAIGAKLLIISGKPDDMTADRADHLMQ